MRRAFQTRLHSLEPRARRVLHVRVEKLGGFEQQSYKLRYRVTLQMPHGRRTLRLRGSSEAQDETRRQSYEIMKFLWNHGFDHGPFQVARPVTFYKRWRLLVYEEASGKTLTQQLRQHPATAGRTLQRVSGWLAKLHSHSPRTIRLAYNQAGRKQYWQNALRLLNGFSAEDASRLRRNIQQIMRQEDRYATQRKRKLVHHDFHPGNILISPHSIVVVDFTESRLSHPLIDVATMAIQLELQNPRTAGPRIRRWQKTFLAGYHRHRPRVRIHGVAADRVFRFIRFRIAMQSYVGQFLFGKTNGPLREIVLHSEEW